MENIFETKDGKPKKGKGVEWFFERRKIRIAENPYTDGNGTVLDKRNSDKNFQYLIKCAKESDADLELLDKEARKEIEKYYRGLKRRYQSEMGL